MTMGILIHAHQRMRSVLMHQMQIAWKRQSASLWMPWNHRNAVDLMTSTDSLNVPLEDCWYAHPQLFFTCVLRPKGGRKPKNPTYKTGLDDEVHSFVFFSTFEELDLPIKGPMEVAGVTKLYERSCC
jgi:hypothetical protein